MAFIGFLFVNFKGFFCVYVVLVIYLIHLAFCLIVFYFIFSFVRSLHWCDSWPKTVENLGSCWIHPSHRHPPFSLLVLSYYLGKCTCGHLFHETQRSKGPVVSWTVTYSVLLNVCPIKK